MLLVLLVGFLLAWVLQTARRHRAIRRLVEDQLYDERTRFEEHRLLADDLAEEQASLIAQQNRRIEHLKQRLAHQIALSNGTPATGENDAQRTKRQAARTPISTRAKNSTNGNDTLISRTVNMATRASALRRVVMPGHAPGGPLPPAQSGPRAQVPEGKPDQNATPDYLRTPPVHDRGLGNAELQVLRRQLRQEQHLNREKARLMRQYESEAARWSQRHQQSELLREQIQAELNAAQAQLQATRTEIAAHEAEIRQLREQLRQQQALTLMTGTGMPRKTTSIFRLRNSGLYAEDSSPAAHRSRIHALPQSLHRIMRSNRDSSSRNG